MMISLMRCVMYKSMCDLQVNVKKIYLILSFKHSCKLAFSNDVVEFRDIKCSRFQFNLHKMFQACQWVGNKIINNIL